jgi:NitT/TauT family transport system permease protein
MRRIAVAALFVAAIVALWQVTVASGRWSPMLLPSPLSVADYLWSALVDGSLLEAAMVTVRGLLRLCNRGIDRYATRAPH